tara:strand:+ start:67 stop:1170 length:1104 start_codon:yes stop_codon:yes gene_type:complete
MSKLQRLKDLSFKFVFEKYRFLKLIDFLARQFYATKHNNYPVVYTRVTLIQVVVFLLERNPSAESLAVVHPSHLTWLKRLFPKIQLYTSEELGDVSLNDCERIFWLTENSDYRAMFIRNAIKRNVLFEPIREKGPARVRHHDSTKERLLAKEYLRQTEEGIENFGYGTGADFENLLQAIDQTADVDGDIVEIGCFNGSSACMIAAYLEQKSIDKTFYVYDVFDGFNYPEALGSADRIWVQGHVSDGLNIVKARVQARSRRFQEAILVKRNICEPDALREIKKISLANIDTDMYEAVYSALVQVDSKIEVNGIIVVEDAGHTPLLIGALAALNQFLDEVGRNRYTVLQFESGQYVCIKRSLNTSHVSD